MITQAILKSKLSYIPEAGIFTKVLKVSGRVKIAGTKNNGYIAIAINKKVYSAHRLAWLYMTGEWPKYMIDHINGIRDDNRFCNLREATNSENQMNRGIPKNNTSGFKGVCWHKQNCKWVAQIKINGKLTHLGCFEKVEDAHQAYCKGAENHHNAFSNTAVKTVKTGLAKSN